jgi:hypothetical protein
LRIFDGGDQTTSKGDPSANRGRESECLSLFRARILARRTSPRLPARGRNAHPFRYLLRAMSLRRTISIRFLGLVSAIYCLACGSSAPNPRQSASTGAAQAKHGPVDAKPGSADDWCGEHNVPESLCTRCNASLIPAFKATGDWCAEHQVPESQCLLCHPELKFDRPAVAAGAGQ